jgi:hypothetical protein
VPNGFSTRPPPAARLGRERAVLLELTTGKNFGGIDR